MHDWQGMLAQPKPQRVQTPRGLYQVRVTLSLRWWLILYLEAIVFFCVLSRRQADHDKLAAVVRKGFKVKYEATPMIESEAHE